MRGRNKWARRLKVIAMLWWWAPVALSPTWGCVNRVDREFRVAVKPVLASAAQLDSLCEVRLPTHDWSGPAPLTSAATAIRDSIESDGERALGEVKLFQSRVRRLPHPRKPELRYLRLKLANLADASEGLARARLQRNRTLTTHGIPSASYMEMLELVQEVGVSEGEWRSRFVAALWEATVAERVATGGSSLPEVRMAERRDRDSTACAVLGWNARDVASGVAAAKAVIAAGFAFTP